MRVNLSVWDRSVRFFLAVMMLTWSIAGGPWWGYLGVYPLITGAWGVCPIYALLNFRTAPVHKREVVQPDA